MTPHARDRPQPSVHVASPSPATHNASPPHPAPSAPVNRDGRPRLPDGHLAVLILQHLHRFPHNDFSPYELAKVLHRSHGAIRTRLLQLADTPAVTRTSIRPARFQIGT